MFATFWQSDNQQKIFCQSVRFLFIELSLSFITTENLLLHHLYHFCCLLIKSLVTESFCYSTLQISVCILNYSCVLGSNTFINVVSVQNTLNLGDLLRKPVILNQKILLLGSFLYCFNGHDYRTFAEIFDLYPRIPERLELFPGLLQTLDCSILADLNC